MSFATSRMLEHLLMPPAGAFILAILGLLLVRFKVGRRLVFLALVLLYASCLPVLGDALIQSLDRYQALDPATLPEAGIEAIVVLGGGYYGEAEEYGEATVGPYFLERLRYASWLYRRSGAPIIVSSGRSDAHTAAQLLVEEFGVPVLAVEDRSWTTQDNASNTAGVLAELDVHTVALVTHGWHMPRAKYSFDTHTRARVLPAPMGLSNPAPDPSDWRQWIPSARAMVRIRTALHELAGLLWYRYRTLFTG